MPGPLTHVVMCERCMRRLWPTLQRPTFQEGVLLEQVAAELERCRTCISQVGKLRAAAKRTTAQNVWAWISDP